MHTIYLSCSFVRLILFGLTCQRVMHDGCSAASSGQQRWASRSLPSVTFPALRDTEMSNESRRGAYHGEVERA